VVSPAGRQVIAASRVVTCAGEPLVLAPGYVVVDGGIIAEVGAGLPPAALDADLRAGTLVPGFVDLQVNGYFGEDLSVAEAGGWEKVAAGLPATGTTAFLPTFITAPLAELTASLRRAASVIPALRGGARVLGVHVEGPFIAPTRRGAHNEQWIADPTPQAVGELIGAAPGLLRLVTLAPERDGALAATQRFTEAGVLVSVGHSDATSAQVGAAAAAGARLVTHLFNGQRPFGHREPGVAGAALADPRLTCGLIADLRHVHAQACAIAFAAAPGRVCLVTDAAPCAGLPPGRYRFGGSEIELPPGEGEPPVLVGSTLAGSALRMDVAVANMVESGVSLASAVAAATRVPADIIGRPDLGRIRPGAAADLAWLGEDLRAGAVWIGGERVY
jgi:N-acetylglucosamine-6-phosphate deacetylase